MRFSRPFHSRSRRTNFCTLPVEVFGRSPNSIFLGAASHSLHLRNVDSLASLLQFLESYQAQILIPHELPAIQRAFRHASRNETRELVAFDLSIELEPLLRPFAGASRRVGQAQLKRLRPLRDQRLVQRYLNAVEEGRAHGWHTLVYGLTLSLYSLPVLQGLASYEKQTLLGFMHAVSRSLRLSEADCRKLLDQLTPSLPRWTESLLGEDEESLRSKLSY
jgi:urease accessory protein UreF